MGTETTREMILIMHMREEKDYDNKTRGAFEAYVMGYEEKRSDEAPVGMLFSHESPLADFGMDASYGRRDLANGGFYALEWGFESKSKFITAYKCERIAKQLKRIDKAIEKSNEEYGRPQTLGQHVVQLMRVLGVKKACWQNRERQGMRTWRTSCSMEDIRFHIDHEITQCLMRQEDQAQA